MNQIEKKEAFKRFKTEMSVFSASQQYFNEVPKHWKTAQGAKVIVAIDGCGNNCTSNILEKYGLEPPSEVEFGQGHASEENRTLQAFHYIKRFKYINTNFPLVKEDSI